MGVTNQSDFLHPWEDMSKQKSNSSSFLWVRHLDDISDSEISTTLFSVKTFPSSKEEIYFWVTVVGGHIAQENNLKPHFLANKKEWADRTIIIGEISYQGKVFKVMHAH